MIIERLDLHAYGHLTDQSFDFSARSIRFHIICGPNEAGKSTTLRAITNWLFGFGHTTEDDYLHRSNQLRVGGRLRRDDGEVLDCIRRKGRVGTLRGIDDETIIEEAELKNMLGGINETTFITQFGLSHDELQRGGQQILRGEGEIGEILFSAGAGISRLQDIQDKLQAELAGLFRSRARNATINQALQQLDADRKQLRQLQLPPNSYVQLQDQLVEQELKIKDLHQRIEELTRRRTSLQATATALESLPRFQVSLAAFNDLADAPNLSDDFADRWRRVQHDRAFQEQLLERLGKRRQELSSQREAVGDEDTILAYSETVEDLLTELPLREKGDSDQEKLRARIRQLDEKMRNRLRDFAGWDSKVGEDLNPKIESLHLSVSQRSAIQRLATQYERVVQSRDDAESEAKQTELKIAELNRQLDEISEDTDPEPLTRALEETGPPEALLNLLDERKELMQQLRVKCESIIKRMGLPTDLEQAIAIPFADSDEVEILAKELEEQQSAIDLAESRASESENEWRTAEQELEAIEDSESLPTVADLMEARRHRDRLIQSLRDGTPSSELWEESVRAVSQCDEVVDLFRTHHEAIHRRQAVADDLERRRQRHAERAIELTDEIEKLEKSQSNWKVFWQSLNVPARTPKLMRQFCIDQLRLADEYAQYLQAQSAMKLVEQRISHASAGIRAALSSKTHRSKKDDLQSLCVEAAHIRNQKVEGKNLRDRLLVQRSELATTLTLARLTLENRKADFENWQRDWQSETQRLSTDKNQVPNEVLPRLDTISQLASDKHEHDELKREEEVMAAEADGYLQRCSRLFSRLDDAPVTNEVDLKTVGMRLATLKKRLESEKIRSAQRERVRADLKLCQTEFDQSQTHLLRLQIESQQLCSECGVTDWGQIESVERRARQKAIALAKLDDARADLLRWAAGKPLNSFVDELQSLSPQVIHDELQTTLQEQQTLQDQMAEEQKKFGALESELKQMDGGDSASELSQSIQLKIGRLRRDVESYVRLNLANQILVRAIEHYRAENQDPVLAAAREYFRTITCGEYSDLKDDFDSNKGTQTILGVRGDVLVPTTQMSTGTADALYLSFRLASLKHQLSDGEKIPLIIDDCLIQLDDDRAAAALQVFAEMSHTTQLILFTHHQHLVDIAQRTLEPGHFQVHPFITRGR